MKKYLAVVLLISTLSLAGVYRNLQFVYATVGIQSGSTVLIPTRGVYAIPSVTGNITVTCGWDQGLTVPQVPATGSLQMELVIDGYPTNNYFSGPPCSQNVDTTKLTDGTHSLAWQILDSTGATYPTDQLRAYSVTFVVMNSGPLNGAQQIATTSDFRHGAVVLDGTDFVNYPGTPVHSAIIPYPYKYIPPNPNQPRNTNNWFVSDLNETRNMTYSGDPQFYQTKKGGVVMRHFAPSFGLSSSQAWKLGIKFHQNFDGGRGDNRVSPYSSIIELADGSGWAGVELNGRMWMIDHTGAVDTCAGPQPKRDVLQYDYRDISITPAQLAAKTNFIGTGDTRMADVTDLTEDKKNPYIFYLADSLDHRILKVNLQVNPPTFENYAGVYGQPGNTDGPAQTAKFNRPFSLITGSDGTLYISDFGNGAIRMVSPDGVTVSTLVGGSQPSMAYVAANKASFTQLGTVSFAQAIIAYPQGLRMDSQERLVLIENATQSVRIIDRTNQTVKTIAVASGSNATESWTWLDVDTDGTIGPQDDILVVIPVGGFKPINGPGSSDLWTVWRISEDGSYVGAMHWNGLQNGGFAPLVEQAVNHYPWAIAISRYEGRFITAGYSSDGLSEFHVLQPSDSTGPLTTSMFNHGMLMWRQGSVTGFPWNSRPSFAILAGWTGGGHAGLSVDGINHQFPAPIPCTSLTQEGALANYIQNGLGGNIPRPELTGNDLRDFIYFLRRSSLQYGEIGNYTACPNQTDITPPIINSIVATRTGPTTATIQWVTNEATLGFVAFGSTVNYSGGSDIETGYASVHTVQLHDLPTLKPTHFAIVSKDLAGNQSNSADGTF